MGKGAKVQDDERDGARQEWGTPRTLFDGLNVERRYTVDACAKLWNAKLPHFWSPEENGLAQVWEGERIFCNPEYNDILPWLARGFTAVCKDPTTVVDYLLPARTGAAWFHSHALRGAVDFFRGRIPFEMAEEVREMLEERADLAREQGDTKLEAKLRRQAKGAQNAEDSILVSFDAVMLDTGYDRVGTIEVARIGLRDPVTGKRLPLEPAQLALPLAAATPPSPAAPPPEDACKLCGEGGGDFLWSALCHADVHPGCVDVAVAEIRSLPPRKRAAAEALLRGEIGA